MDYHFGKKYRLLKTDDFSSVFALRCQKNRAWIQVFQARNALGFPRLGLIVAKKVARRANRRNYMKRVLREWFRLHRHELPPVDIIIRIRQPFRHTEYADVVRTLRQLLVATDGCKATSQ
ncbi:ribonuclease P protein component [Snodgrassella communis]|uniref:ribonuclease P protein component n=1 Tax=Snodgrassella communis TaxID=2946699 RepID=UPI000C1F140D|nr:ribonuclease P protein component [Snodgrassella communis]PIT20080.1 ribonuclease P protein component [Snodgrassella communis]